MPSWQLTGAILVVDAVATLMCVFGIFVSERTHIVTVVRVWVFSFGVFCIMAGVYFLLENSPGFDNLMNGRRRGGREKEMRRIEDFGESFFVHFSFPFCLWLLYRHLMERALTTCVVVSLQRVAALHERLPLPLENGPPQRENQHRQSNTTL